MVDAVPALCIGGDGANTYTTDAALTIDLGGDDIWTNSAGGADPVDNDLPVSVALDLGGNDIYRSAIPAPSGALAVQGAGYLGGIGFLVDDGGNDAYSNIATATGAQGMGQAVSFAGVGVLVDQAGNDAYHVRSEGSGNLLTTGQSFAILGSTSVLIDRAGDDTYLTESHPAAWEDADGLLHASSSTSDTAGSATFGSVALFSDEGGNDSVGSDAWDGDLAPTEDRPLAPTDLPGVVANAGGLAAAGGVAMALTGDGSTHWTIRSTSTAPLTDSLIGTGANAFGIGITGGVGVVSDAGGDDIYDVAATATADVQRSIDDSCQCSGVAAVASPSGVHTYGQGEASAGGVGLLRDEGGNDTYLAAARTDVRTSAADHRTVDVQPTDPEQPVGAAADSETGVAVTQAQGAGLFGAGGFLLDEGGDDSYTATAATNTSATATSDLDPTQATALAISGNATTFAQAVGIDVGYGELYDSGGRDSYSVENSSSSAEVPSGGGYAGDLRSVGQAGVDGGADGAAGASLLVDTNDSGAADTFHATPPDPACTGTRGGDRWQDCAGPGYGFNQ
jgi:hypothetical protein